MVRSKRKYTQIEIEERVGRDLVERWAEQAHESWESTHGEVPESRSYMEGFVQGRYLRRRGSRYKSRSRK